MIAESFRAQERRVDAYVERLKMATATAVGPKAALPRGRGAAAKTAGKVLEKLNPKDGSPRSALLLADKKLVGALLKATVAKEAGDLGAPVSLFGRGQRDFADAIALYLLAHARLSGTRLQGEKAQLDAFRRVLHGNADESALQGVVNKVAPAAAARVKPEAIRRVNKAAKKVAPLVGKKKLVGKEGDRGAVADVNVAAAVAAGAAVAVVGGVYNTDRIIRNARKMFGPAKAEW